MAKSSYKIVSQGDIKGCLKEEIWSLLPATFFEDPVSSAQKAGAKVIKESMLRWAAILPLPQGRRIFLKRDRTKGGLHSLKYFFLPSKARKEWFIAYQTKKRNLNIPQPLGWIEKEHFGCTKESIYLSEAIGSGISLLEEPVIAREGFALDELAKTVRKIHDSGLFHQDLHGGNFLWDGESFFLTDLHRAKILRSVSLNQRLWNLSQLFHSLQAYWGKEEQMSFLEKYFKQEFSDLQKKGEAFDKIISFMKSLQRRQWKSRTKRCLKESTEFSVKREEGAVLYHRRDFSTDRLVKVIEDHLCLLQTNPTLLVKKSPEVNVSILKDGENKISVKQFCYPRFWDGFKEFFRISKGLRAWVSGNGLKVRGVGSPILLALVERRRGLAWRESFLVMETPEHARELDRYLLEGFGGARKKRQFIKTLANWLASLHEKNLYHRDMKTCNILVLDNQNTWKFYLLDLEDVRLDKKINEKRLFKNFLQLNTSTPNLMTRADRFRFFKAYQERYPIIRNEKRFLRRLLQKSRERGIVYVSSHGVVEEELF